MLVLTDESKDTLKKFEEMLSKVKDLIRSITNNSDDYDERYMKIKFNSDDDLPVKEMSEFCNIMLSSCCQMFFMKATDISPKFF